MKKFMDILGLVVLAILAPIQIYLSYIGIAVYFGEIVSLLIILLSLVLQFPIPIMIGAFFGAYYVLGIHWIWALLIIIPGVVFMSPHVIKDTISRIKSK